ncbi:MAG: hypothetical protein ABI689_15335 [Thermoanaerobaculia bacterium]
MTGGFLIVRCDGALWGLPADQVALIERSVEASGAMAAGGASGLEVRFADGRRLAVDAVLTLVGELVARPLSPRLRQLLPPGAAGLAMLAGEPLVLMARESEVAHV